MGHEIQFTGLIGGNEKAYENFREFINTEDTPDKLTLKNINKENLQKALTQLTPTEQELIKSLYFDTMTEAEYANQTHVKQQTVHKKKVKKFNTLRLLKRPLLPLYK